MTILYAYLIAGALFVVATWRLRVDELRKERKRCPDKMVTAYYCGAVFGVGVGVLIWPLIAIALAMDTTPDDEWSGDA